MGKGGADTSGYNRTPPVQKMESTTSRIPEFAQPYFHEMMGRTAYETTRPYEAYPGQRLADFTEAERAAQSGIAGMADAGAPPEMGMASDITSQIGYGPQISGMDVARGFQPQRVRSNYRSSYIDPGYQAGQLGQGYQAGQRGQEYQAGQFDPGYAARELGQDYTARELAAQYTGAGAPGGAQFGPGFEAGTMADSETIQQYMNPYQRMVTDIEKREAQRQSDVQASGTAQQASQAGGLGGYREAIMQAERERNLSQQMGDIEMRGGQAAFQQAQQAFEADRAARLQAGQLGLQTGQAREQALQQAEQYRQSAFGTSESARQAQQQMQTAAFRAGEEARQRAGAMGMTAQQAEDAGRQAQEQFGQAQFGQNEQVRLAQQEANRTAYQAQQQAMQEAGRLGLSAQEIQERGRQAANQAYMQAQQFNVDQGYRQAQLGMTGLGEDRAGRQQRLMAAQQLGQLGGQQQQMGYERMRMLQAMGQGQRQLGQQSMDMGYQDFLRQQRFPREQLSYLSNLVQGLPLAPMYNQTGTTYGGPTGLQQALGAGIGGVGLYNQMRPRAAGGGRVPGVAGVGLHRALRAA